YIPYCSRFVTGVALRSSTPLIHTLAPAGVDRTDNDPCLGGGGVIGPPLLRGFLGFALGRATAQTTVSEAVVMLVSRGSYPSFDTRTLAGCPACTVTTIGAWP